MANEPDAGPGDASADSVDEMMQHLEKAKERTRAAKKRRRKSNPTTGLQAKVQQRTDTAVLASNFETRLEEIVANDAVTHRSGKPWKSAKVGVASHGRLPIYYRLDGEITHTGYISRIVLNPDENTDDAAEFVEHISDDDTYGEYHELLDTTTYLVTDGERLDEPFPQTELEKLSGEGTIEEGYSRQPAYVVQRAGDFPDFP